MENSTKNEPKSQEYYLKKKHCLKKYIFDKKNYNFSLHIWSDSKQYLNPGQDQNETDPQHCTKPSVCAVQNDLLKIRILLLDAGSILLIVEVENHRIQGYI